MSSEQIPGQAAQPPEHQAYPIDSKERMFDENVRKTLKELKQEEKEVCNIRIKMPHINYLKLMGYQSFLNNETYENKLEFL